MNQQLADRQKELEAAEARRTAFEASIPKWCRAALGALQRLEAGAVRTARDRCRSRGRAKRAGGDQRPACRHAADPAGVGPTGGARGALAQASAELAGMRARGLTDNHPDVIAIKNQIASLAGAWLQAEGNASVSGVPNPAYSSLVSIKAERQANVQALQSRARLAAGRDGLADLQPDQQPATRRRSPAHQPRL